jgi:hypothetical protein
MDIYVMLIQLIKKMKLKLPQITQIKYQNKIQPLMHQIKYGLNLEFKMLIN